MPTTDDATLTDWIEHALNECGDIISLLDNDGHSQGKSLAIGLRATLLTMKGQFGDEADTGFSSGEAGSYTALQWRDEKPTEPGWYWHRAVEDGEVMSEGIMEVKTHEQYGLGVDSRYEGFTPLVEFATVDEDPIFAYHQWAGPIHAPDEAESAV